MIIASVGRPQALWHGKEASSIKYVYINITYIS